MVTWVGTALVGAWAKATQKMRDAKKEFTNTQTEIERLKSKTDLLIANLYKNGKSSLHGVVKELCEMFPDFADAIKDAADEAAKTGSYDKLRDKLKEITDLQSKVLANKALQGMYDANLNAGARMMRTAKTSEQKKAGTYELQQYFDKEKVAKELQEAIYERILAMHASGASNSKINDYVHSVAPEVNMDNLNTNKIGDLYKIVGKLKTYSSQINSNNSVINEYESEQAAIQFRQQLEDEATQLGVKFSEAISDADLQEAIDKAKERTTVTHNDSGGSSKSSGKSTDDVENDLQKTIGNVNDDFQNGFIDAETALKEMTSAFKKAYEDLRDLTGAKGTDNKYFDKYSKLSKGEMGLRGANGLSEIERLPKLDSTALQAKAVVQNPQTELAKPTMPSLNLDGTAMDQMVAKMDAFNSLGASAVGIMQNLGGAFDTLTDTESS